MARLAGEGEEALVAAISALKARESGGEVAAAMELTHDVDGVGAKRTVDGAVALLVASDKVGPSITPTSIGAPDPAEALRSAPGWGGLRS
jgi:hypothetical protein